MGKIPFVLMISKILSSSSSSRRGPRIFFFLSGGTDPRGLQLSEGKKHTVMEGKGEGAVSISFLRIQKRGNKCMHEVRWMICAFFLGAEGPGRGKARARAWPPRPRRFPDLWVNVVCGLLHEDAVCCMSMRFFLQGMMETCLGDFRARLKGFSWVFGTRVGGGGFRGGVFFFALWWNCCGKERLL